MSLLSDLEAEVNTFEAKCADFVNRIRSAAQRVRNEIAAAEKAVIPSPHGSAPTGVSDPSAPPDASATSVPPSDPS